MNTERVPSNVIPLRPGRAVRRVVEQRRCTPRPEPVEPAPTLRDELVDAAAALVFVLAFFAFCVWVWGLPG